MPNVNNSSYVNSGPGVGLSEANGHRSERISSSGSSSSSRSYNDTSNDIAITNLTAMRTLPAMQEIKEKNPRSLSAYDVINPSYSASDMDDYIDKIMGINEANNKWSAEQAKKQMDYQTQSDKTAMSWSAQEAAKTRDWQERLSNTAHQREVKDLIAAGLNPILATNNGAYTGSGATAQGFSSSGAMGDTDMTGASAVGSILSQMMTTARDVAVTRMYNDTAKYQSDQQYAAAKLASEASIYNNNNSVSAQKAIASLNRDADIQKANISASATRAAANANAGAIMSAANANAAAARYNAEMHADAQMYSAEQSANAIKYSSNNQYKGVEYSTKHDVRKNPYGYLDTVTDEIARNINSIANVYYPNTSDPNSMFSSD